MKKQKRIAIVLTAILLCGATIFATLAFAADDGIVTEGEMIDIKNDFSAYLVQDTRRVADDGYVGALQYTVYYDTAKGSLITGIGGTPVIAYAINTSTERVGTDSNKTIIQSMLDRGYAVVVLDYLGNSAATGKALDDSAQRFIMDTKAGKYFTRGEGTPFPSSGQFNEVFVVPSGCNVLLNQVFWSIDKHSADGTLDKIVENWNTDFKGTKADRLVKWATGDDVSTRKTVATAKDGTEPSWYNAAGAADPNGLYTKVKYTVAQTITDCVKPDGSPLDMDLTINLVYPTNPAKEVPVLSLSCCWGYNTNSHMCYTDLCSHNTGALFRGYAAATYDYLWQPMGRDSAFGYYDGNLNTNGAVTGDHMNYSLHLYNDKLVNTAAIRYLRYLALSDNATYKFDMDAFATIGLSKGGWFSFLGEEVLQTGIVDASLYSTTEELEAAIDLALAAFEPRRIFDGHHGETRYQAGNTSVITGGTYVGKYALEGGTLQPWLTYNGTEIVSGVQLTYAANGSQEEDITAGHSPIFAAAHMDDEYNAAYGSANQIARLAKYLDIPLVFFEVDQLHEYAHTPDMFYGVQTYDAFFTFANYYLKGAPVEVLYTDPMNNDGDISLTDKITVQFSGAVSASEVAKITVSSGSTVLDGYWEKVYGGTQWVFYPENMKGGTTYTITVPADLAGDNGVVMGSAYTAQFVTEGASDIELDANADANAYYYTITAPAALADGYDSYVFRFYVSNNAANVAKLYDNANGTLIGSVNLRGVGTYEIDITDYVAANAGKTLTLKLASGKAVGVTTLRDTDVTSYTDISTYGIAPAELVKLDSSGNETDKGTISAVRVYIDSNKGTYGGGDAFYERMTTALAFRNLLGNKKITKDDLGRQIEITLRIYDTESRTVLLYLNSMTSSSLKVMDYDSPTMNITTVAGEWIDVTVPYTVYDTDYGTGSINTKSLFFAISPTGDTHKPIYVSHYSVRETVTDMSVSSAALAMADLGKAPYKAPEASQPFSLYNGTALVGAYDTWNAVFTAYSKGNTVKLNSNYVLTNADLYSDFGTKADSIIIDLNGYTITCDNTTNSLIWAKSTSVSIPKTVITIKNGGIVLGERPLVSYEGSNAAGSGKIFNINLADISIYLAKGSCLTSLISDTAVTTGVKVQSVINLDECNIDLGDESDRAGVMLNVFAFGKGMLDLSYKVTGGSIAMTHPRWITIQENATYAEYFSGNNGYMKLYIPSAYSLPNKVSFLLDNGYADPVAGNVTANVTEYSLVRGEGSTRYGVIPSEYSDTNVYPFVLFRDGTFIGAYKGFNAATVAAHNAVKGTAYLNSEAQLLLRRDFESSNSDFGATISYSTNILIDLGGYTFTNEWTGLDLVADYANAPYTTYIKIKNGNIRIGTIAFVDNQIFANNTGVKKFHLVFEGINFSFKPGMTDNWGCMLHTQWTANNSACPSHTTIEYNDCTFDLRNYTVSKNMVVFSIADGKNILNTDIVVNGGRFITDSLSRISLVNADPGDSFKIGRGSDGNYPILVTATGAVFTDNFTATDGSVMVYKQSASDATLYELSVNTYATKYGIIPSEYGNSEAYPFVAFKGGEFKGAYATFKAAVEAGVSLSNESDATILMRRAFTVTAGNGSNINTLNGNLTIDLGGYVLAGEHYVLDQYICTQHLTTAGKLTVLNGSMLRVTDLPIFGMNQGSQSTTEKPFDLVFDGVTFMTTHTSTNGILIDTWDNNPLSLNVKVTFKDCVFDFTGAAAGTPIVDAGTVENYTKMSINVVGGTVIADNISKYTIASTGAEDSIVYSTDANNSYTKLITPSTAAPSTNKYPTAEGMMYFVKIATDGANSVYTLATLTTPYGTVSDDAVLANNQILNAYDYPFFIFRNNAFVGVYKSWKAAVVAARGMLNTSSSVGKTVEIVMRRDYDVTAAIGDAGNNFNDIYGTIIADLGGYTINTVDTYLIDVYLNYNNNGSILGFKSSMIFRNGTISNSRNGLPSIGLGHTGAPASGAKAKELGFGFENITFKTSVSPIMEDFQHDAPTGMYIDLDVTECVFDYTGAQSGAVTFKFKPSRKHVVLDATFCGITLIASDMNSYNIVTFDDEDSAVIVKRSDGSYGTLIQSATAGYPNFTMATADGNVVSFMDGALDGTDKIYELTEGVVTKYGYIPARYSNAEAYPFVLFRNGKFVIATALFGKDASESALNNSKPEGTIILLRRDFVYNENQYNNLSQTYTNVVFDLDGHTFTSVARKMFSAQKKTANNTGLTIKNGTIILGAGPLMTFSSWDPSTGGWDPYKGGCGFDFVFENVTITLADGATTSNVICDNNFGSADPDQFVNLTFINSIIDVSGSAKSSVTLFDMSSSLCNINVVMRGGEIRGGSMNFLSATVAHPESGIVFDKGDDGRYTTLALSGGNTPDFGCDFITAAGIECAWRVTNSESGYVMYELVPAALTTFSVKSSVSFWSDFVYNIYVPVSDIVTSAMLDGVSVDLSTCSTVDIDGESYYKLTVSLPSSIALRNIDLKITVNVGGAYTLSYTFSTLRYAEIVSSGDYSIEEKALAHDMLSYIRAAYAYFGTASEAADVLARVDALLGDAYDTENAPDMTKEAKTPSIPGLTSVTLNLSATPTYRFYVAQGYTAADFTFTVGSQIVETTEGEDSVGKYLELVMYGYRMADTITVSSEGATGEYNVYSYYGFVNSNYATETALITLVERFVKYCESAKAYRDLIASV